MKVPIAALCSLNVRLALLASVACSLPAHALAQTAPAIDTTQPVTATAIALVLPNQQGIFAAAAEAVRQGFFAAHKLSGSTATIQVIEVGDDIEQVGIALAAARDRGVRVAVGPLRRDEVTAIVEGGRAVLPLVALNFPDRDAAAPATMIAFGLSAEAEAERVVQIALASFVNLRPGRFDRRAHHGAGRCRRARPKNCAGVCQRIARGGRGTGDGGSDARRR